MVFIKNLQQETNGSFAPYKKRHFFILFLFLLFVLFILFSIQSNFAKSLLGGFKDNGSSSLQSSGNSSNNQFSPKVLAADDKKVNGLFTLNVPSIFNADIKLNDKNIDAGNGKIFASNIIYTVASGTGIQVSGGQNPTIANTDRGSAQNIFKTINVNGQAVTATSNNSVLNFVSSNNELKVQNGQILFEPSIGNQPASALQNGYLTLTDYQIFNAKVSSVTAQNGVKNTGTLKDPVLEINAGNGLNVTSNILSALAGDNSVTIDSNGIKTNLNTNGGLITTTNGVGIRADCNSGDVIKWDGTGWLCGVDAGGSSYVGGTGINITGSTISNTGVISVGTGTGISNTGTAKNPVFVNTGVTTLNSIGGALSLAGTTNQINIANGVSTITLSLPQNINTTSSPTFAGLTVGSLSGVLKASSGVVSGSATTTDIPQGSNLYFTVAGARASISGTSPIGYNSSTGVISISQATTSTNGYLSLTDWNTFNNKVSSQWITSGSNIYYNSGNVGIGNTSPGTTKLLVTGTSDNIQFAVKANSSQFAHIFEIQNSIGTPQIYVDNNYFLSAPKLNTNNIGTYSGSDLYIDATNTHTHLLSVDDGTFRVNAADTDLRTPLKNNTGNLTLTNNIQSNSIDFTGTSSQTGTLTRWLAPTWGSSGNRNFWEAIDTNGTTTLAKLDRTGALTVASCTGCGTSSQWTTSGSNIYYNTGNVGIGNTNPSYDLQIGSNIYFNTSDNSGSLTIPLIRNTGTGLLTSAIASGNSTYPLVIGAGNLHLRNLYVIADGVVSTDYASSSFGGGVWDGTSAGHFAGSANGTELGINVATSFTGNLVDLQKAGSSKFIISSSGNNYLAGGLGVGTANSTAGTLKTLGNGYIGGGLLDVNDPSSSKLTHYGYNSIITRDESNATYYDFTQSVRSFSLVTGVFGEYSSALNINSSGNTSIGGNLGVGTAANSTNQVSVLSPSSASDIFKIKSQDGSNSNQSYLRILSALDNEVFNIKSGADIGAGTTNVCIGRNACSNNTSALGEGLTINGVGIRLISSPWIYTVSNGLYFGQNTGGAEDFQFLPSSVTPTAKANRGSAFSVYRPAFFQVDTNAATIPVNILGNASQTASLLQLKAGSSWGGSGNRNFWEAIDTDGTTTLAKLDRTGGAYFAGNVGIGTISPIAKLNVLAGTSISGTGTITTSSSSSGQGATVTGSGTAFTTQLHVGDTITVSGQSKTIVAISSDTSLIVDTDFSPNISSGTVFTYTQPIQTLANNSGSVLSAFTYTGDFLSRGSRLILGNDTPVTIQNGPSGNPYPNHLQSITLQSQFTGSVILKQGRTDCNCSVTWTGDGLVWGSNTGSSTLISTPVGNGQNYIDIGNNRSYIAGGGWQFGTTSNLGAYVGYNVGDGSGAPAVTGIKALATGIATSSNNYDSTGIRLESSYWNGSSAENPVSIFQQRDNELYLMLSNTSVNLSEGTKAFRFTRSGEFIIDQYWGTYSQTAGISVTSSSNAPLTFNKYAGSTTSTGGVEFYSGGSSPSLVASLNGSGNFSTTGTISSSKSGAASTSALSLTGAPSTAGTTTTDFPLLRLETTGASAVTTWDTNGTYFGVNTASGFTGNFLDFHVNGAASIFSVTSAGKVTAAAGFNGTCRTDGVTASGPVCNQDVAEVYDTSEQVEAGDIVSININETSKVEKSKSIGDNNLMGIVSTNPGLIFDDGETRLAGANDSLITAIKAPIALSGKVLVKVVTKNGNIKAGDLITSSDIPGVGQKSTGNGYVVGKALESYNEVDKTKVGKILIFVNLTYFAPGQMLTGDDVNMILSEKYTALETRVTKLEARVDSIEDKQTAGEAIIKASESEVTVTFEKPYANAPIINITPKDDLDSYYYLLETTLNGFKIKIKNIQTKDIRFNWVAIKKE